MPIPPQKDIQIPLLHLIHNLGGEVRPHEVYKILANYFRLTEKEREEMLPSGDRKFNNRVRWARNFLCESGFLDRYSHGTWKITEKGREELFRKGLIDKPFPRDVSLQSQDVLISPKVAKELKSDDEEIIELILHEIAPNGVKKFPDDFLDTNYTEFFEIDLPGTQLHLAPLSQTIITSPKGYFRYQAKNPPEARYILYAHNVGSKKIRIPRDNLTLFKTVKSYEKYCDELARRAFELFLEFTHDEGKAEELTKEATRRLQLKGKLLILGKSRG
jgi:hypothetical protein